jgi:putative peptidoglycan binding protein
MNRIYLLGLAIVASAALSQPLYAKDDKTGRDNRDGRGGGKHAASAQTHAAAPAHVAARSAPSGGFRSERGVASRPAKGFSERSFAQTDRSFGREHAVTKSNAATRTARIGNERFARGSGERFARSSDRFGSTRGRMAANRASFGTRAAFRGSVAAIQFRAGSFHPEWRTGRDYWWHRHHWRCFNGVWAVVDIGWPVDYAVFPYPFCYGGEVYFGGEPVYAAPAYVESAPAGSGSVVADVQSELAREGYDPGPIDGVAGSMTREAIAEYQRDHGLAPTGRINGSLLRSMGID